MERAPWTRQAILDVQQEISEAQPPGFLGVGVQDKSVVVFLSEGHHHTAASLKDRYGSQVQVIIGDPVGYSL